MASKTRKQIAEEFPVAVTLRFKSEAQKRSFMGGLCDGWGENACDLHWPWPDAAFDETEMFGVEVPSDEDDEETQSESKAEP